MNAPVRLVSPVISNGGTIPNIIPKNIRMANIKPCRNHTIIDLQKTKSNATRYKRIIAANAIRPPQVWKKYSIVATKPPPAILTMAAFPRVTCPPNNFTEKNSGSDVTTMTITNIRANVNNSGIF